MEKKQIDIKCKEYHKYCIWITVLLALIVIGAMALGMLSQRLATPLAVCVVYTLIMNFSYGKVWKHISTHSSSVLGKFYMASSAIRLFAAAAVVLIFCITVKDKELIRSFVLLFFLFYVVMLVFDSVFFSRIEKYNKVKEKK